MNYTIKDILDFQKKIPQGYESYPFEANIKVPKIHYNTIEAIEEVLNSKELQKHLEDNGFVSIFIKDVLSQIKIEAIKHFSSKDVISNIYDIIVEDEMFYFQNIWLKGESFEKDSKEFQYLQNIEDYAILGRSNGHFCFSLKLENNLRFKCDKIIEVLKKENREILNQKESKIFEYLQKSLDNALWIIDTIEKKVQDFADSGFQNHLLEEVKDFFENFDIYEKINDKKDL